MHDWNLLLCAGTVCHKRKVKGFRQEAGGYAVLKHSWLPLGAEGKTDCMEAEHQVKDKTAAAELLTRQNQLETVMT